MTNKSFTLNAGDAMAEEFEIVVTDLTRFGNKEILCTAGLTVDGRTCIRPFRNRMGAETYLTFEECKRLNILPGMKLKGIFTPVPNAEAPHTEDMYFSKLSVINQCSSEEFENILEQNSVEDLSTGFRRPVTDKVFLASEEPPPVSIITLKVNCNHLNITEDNYGKLRAHLNDPVVGWLRNLPISDLGFFDNVGSKSAQRISVADVNTFIHSQDSLYLRVGLTRQFEIRGRDGYWIQINGIYTFPGFARIIRRY